MEKQNFTRKEVTIIISEILQYADQVIDSIENENTVYDSEMLLKLAEKEINFDD